MKKKLFLFIAFLMLGITSMLAENYQGCVILEHNGEETYFEAKDIQKAFDAAVEGDVIHISDGNFPQPVSVKKLVNIKSNTGQWFSYNFEIPGNPSIDKPFIECNGGYSVTIKNNLQNIIFRNNGYVDLGINSGVAVENVVFDRTTSWNINILGTLKKISANNTRIGRIWKDSEANIESGEFTNCTFESSYIDVPNAKYVNSILRWNCDDCEPYKFTNCTFTNCLMTAEKWVVDETAKTNCWVLDSETFSEDKDYLLSNGYLGTDNTVVGCYGGTTPYKGGGMTGPSPDLQNLNKKGNKMSPEYYIHDN